MAVIILKSANIGRGLIQLLYVSLVASGFQAILRFFEIAFPQTSVAIVSLKSQLLFPTLGFNLIILIALLTWIYRLHQDLLQCYSNYPIHPQDALYRFILPGYNIWGIWNTLISISRYFQADTGKLQKFGVLLQRLVVSLYGIAIASTLLHRFVYRKDGVGRISVRELPEPLIVTAIVGKTIIEWLAIIVLITIVQRIQSALQLKFSRRGMSHLSI
ncbi:hypothetical protein QM565_00445 [Geitlerinema splendidum]|nr:hypothetical protein [Geitlerinema splendidum]